MTKAFLDTTILADATLKDRAKREFTRQAIRQYAVTALPAYAIKEFKAGPLDYYKWWHNVLAQEQSFESALGRLHRISLTLRINMYRTVIEAMRRAEQDYTGGGRGRVRAEGLRRRLKRAIFSAWKDIHRLANHVTDPLDCYEVHGPYELPDGMIVLKPQKCKTECALARGFHSRQEELLLLAATVQEEAKKRENTKRLAAIAKLQQCHQLTDSECRALGDVVFALLAPDGFVILTTNVRDHGPLAATLGKRAVHPGEVI